MAFQESLQNTLRGPTFIGISIGGGIIAAFAAAGVVSVSLSKIILLCVWGVLVAEVSFAKWFNRAKGYRYSLLLFIVLVSGIGDVYLGAVIANMKYKQDEAARLHPKSENTPSPDTATKTHRTPDGFLQFSQIVLNKNYSQIVPGKVLGMNMGFVGKVKPVHNAYTFMKLAVVDVTPTGQAQFLKTARDMTKKEYGGALKQWKNGKDIGIDEVLWDTIKVGPLDEETATRLLEGQSLVYVYRWAKWKDPAESVGTIEACRWLQWPQSNQLRQEDMVWQVCSVPQSYCFLRPLIVPGAGFILWIENPTAIALDDVSFSMIEEPEKNESMERSMERAQQARKCKIGHVRANFSIGIPVTCQYPVPIKQEKENKFYFEIDSRDEIFFEELSARWDGKQWQTAWDLTRQSDKKKLVSMKGH